MRTTDRKIFSFPAVLLVGSFILMSRISLALTLIIFAALPFMIIFVAIKRVKMREAFRLTRVAVGEINAGLENSIAGIRVSKAYDNREAEDRSFEKGNRRFVSVRGEAYKQMGQFHAGNTFVGDFLQVAMYLAGGLFCFYGRITVGDFAAFLLYIGVFMDPIKRLIGFVEQYQNGMSGFRRFAEIMDCPVEEDDPDAEDIETSAARSNSTTCPSHTKTAARCFPTSASA